jgi:hypothetical protein
MFSESESGHALSNISEQVLRAAEAILEAPAGQLAESVRTALEQFVSSDFVVGSGAIVDASGKPTPSYPIVVYRADSGRTTSTESPKTIPADRVAVVIEVYQKLDVECLRQAYSRIAEVKQLAKTPVPRGETRTNITLGVVFALKSSVSLDTLADELYQLNIMTPHKHWLDMLAHSQIVSNLSQRASIGNPTS